MFGDEELHIIGPAIEAARREGIEAIGWAGELCTSAPEYDALRRHLLNDTLIVETLENTDIYTPTVLRLSHLVVMDILSTAVSLRRGEAHHERIIAMKAGLARLRATEV